MSDHIADVLMHIDENTTHEAREKLRDELLGIKGVVAASYHDEKPHLIVLAYDPEVVKSSAFIKTAQELRTACRTGWSLDGVIEDFVMRGGDKVSH